SSPRARRTRSSPRAVWCAARSLRTLARMLTLHLVRHGDTEASGEGVFCGDLDPPLTPRGMEQAEALAVRAESLELSALYVSPKLRARMTAEPICRVAKL